MHVLWIMCFLSRTLEGCLSTLNVLCLYASARRYRKGPFRIVLKAFKVVFSVLKAVVLLHAAIQGCQSIPFFSLREFYIQMPNRAKGFSLETLKSPNFFTVRPHLFKLYTMHFLSSHWGPSHITSHQLFTDLLKLWVNAKIITHTCLLLTCSFVQLYISQIVLYVVFVKHCLLSM